MTNEVTAISENERTSNGMLVVGIGASAGGLEALEVMFDQMPNDAGMAFVVVQHLSPDFKSLMVELLERHTGMPVYRVEDGMVVEPNSLYLIPPKQDMIIKDGQLLLTERQSPKTLSLPIDLFFRSLALDKGADSVGIILSGTGSDGSRGIQDIKEAGGLVVVQSPESAKFDGMPNNAINTNHADVITSPDKIATMLGDYSMHRDRAALLKEMDSVEGSSMERIFRSIMKRHRVDFSQYRPTTIGRRIERRIDMDRSIDSLNQYANLLEQDESELNHLYQDLLIGVTGFFRDVRPFDSLKHNALQKLLDAHPEDEEFRVWVAACATGEEAYSVAILVDECLKERRKNIEVKIFATDINQAAIHRATTGIYSEQELEGVSEKRRNEYFAEVEGGFQITPHIRRMVVFAPHNLIKDPPFTRLSLVTCRNFLIYLMPEAQAKVVFYFHFALKKDGYLLLGSSESPGELGNEFESVDSACRLYRKSRDVRLRPQLFPDSLIRPLADHKRLPSQHQAVSRPREDSVRLSAEEALNNLVPPGIVVDRDGRVIQVFRDAGKYLRVRDGLLSANLLDMVEKDLRLALGSAIQRCTKRREEVRYERLQMRSIDDAVSTVRLTVTPLPKGDEPQKFVITFEQLVDNSSADTVSSQSGRLDLDEASQKRLEDLEEQLQHNREILQATNEEMETSNEELQATNEELVASNEELQSANEELHSVNEELFTVNGEYQHKISELTELTLDFDNLLESTNIHTLFLDQELRIRKFTPRMAEVLHLVPHDIGRHIDAFIHNVQSDDFADNLSKVLETGVPWEEQIHINQNDDFLIRVLPYRANQAIFGVVVTLIDISSLAQAQAAVEMERERFQRAIQANRDGTWDWPDLRQPEMWWSPRCYQILGYEPNEFPATHPEWLKLVHPDDRKRIQQSSMPDQDECFVEIHKNFEYRMMHRSGEYRWYCHRAIVDHDENGVAVRMTGTVADIEDRKRAEESTKKGIKLRDNFLSMLSHELRNPLGAVTNAMANLKDFAAAKPDFGGLEELDVIERQTAQMTRLLDDLLDVARFGRDKIEFRKEVVDLCETVATVIESVGYRIANKKQKLNTSICEGPVTIIGDPARIVQAQINLLVNASKFSDEGQTISYQLTRENDEALITITDDGTGISDEMSESIFELFVQSDATLHRTAGGMGVGLSLAQKIVLAHQGTIHADSDGVGKGSIFSIRLPLTSLKKEDNEKERWFDKTIPDSSTANKILLVEDNTDTRKMLARTLRLKGFDVLDVGSGQAAVDQIHDFQPIVAIIDINLPGISGLEVAQAIRLKQEFDDTLLIALTGYGQAGDKVKAKVAGFDHHLTKPLDFQKLYGLIAEHLNQT